MSIKPKGVIINSELYIQTDRDVMYNNFVNYLYGTGILNTLTSQIIEKEHYGEDASFLYEKLFFIRVLVHYNMLIRIAITKADGTIPLEDIYSQFNLKCLREVALCKYHIENLFDGLLNLSPYTGPDGLDFMILEGYFDFPPFLIP